MQSPDLNTLITIEKLLGKKALEQRLIKQFLDFKRNEESICFTMMCVFVTSYKMPGRKFV